MDSRRIIQGAGVRIVLTPVQAPNANAYAERFVRSIRAECLDRLILFRERRLLRALDEFVAHYHGERNHQGLGNELIIPAAAAAGTQVRCRDRLGGLLRYYHRAARAWDEYGLGPGAGERLVDTGQELGFRHAGERAQGQRREIAAGVDRLYRSVRGP
jgi:transposase InsO family protein